MLLPASEKAGGNGQVIYENTLTMKTDFREKKGEEHIRDR